jgi:hypothetical protein
MITDADFIRKLESVKILLQKEISESEQGLYVKSMQQLKIIYTELEQMKNRKNYVPIFPKIIIDSWDYNDSLGQELMELLTLYRKLK